MAFAHCHPSYSNDPPLVLTAPHRYTRIIITIHLEFIRTLCMLSQLRIACTFIIIFPASVPPIAFNCRVSDRARPLLLTFIFGHLFLFTTLDPLR